MRVKKTVATVVILMCLLGVFAPGASAGEAWYDCTVNYAGPGEGSYWVNLTHTAAAPAFTERWYILDPAHYKEYLAVALTAITSDMVVMVYVNPVEYSVVKAMYIRK